MTDIEITLNAWEQNYVPVLAVQGESEGRTIVAALIDRTGQTDQTFNAASVDRPINLTGVSSRLYCIKPDGTKTFSDGTVTDAANGIASFVLPYQATASAGDVECQILLTKADNSTLKTIGLHLSVQASDLEDAAESTSEFSALTTALNQVGPAVEQTTTAVSNCNAATSAANTATASANSAALSANTAASSANTAASNANGKATLANAAAQSANTAASAANTAKSAADTATASATAAASSANAAASNASDKAALANTAASGANDAATGANNAAALANKAAGTMYASMSIDPSTGELSMSTEAGYTGADFDINNNGELEVTI